MKHSLLFILLISLLLFSCGKQGEDTKTIDFGEFTMEVPEDWQSFSRQGYDSKVGGITNGKDELVYDYGWYSYDFKHQTLDTHSRTTTTIDGKPALIVQPKERGEGIIGIFIEVDEQLKFNLYGEDIRDEKTVLEIFHSLRFEE